MSRRFIGASLLAAAVLASPWHASNPALAQNKKKAAAAKVDPVDSGKLPAGEFVGILKTTPGSDRLFDVECMYDRLVPTGKKNNGRGNNGGNNRGRGNNRPPNMNAVNQAQSRIQQAMQHGQQAQMMLANARNPQQAKQAQAALNKARTSMSQAENQYHSAVLHVLSQENAHANAMMAQAIRRYKLNAPAGFRIDKVKTLVEFQGAETVKVRTMVLPEEFDEKGNPKKRTKAELATLKGKDTHLPGYESSLEKLETGQKLRVTLSSAKKHSAKSKTKEDDPDKDAVEKPSTEKKMHVRLIVILEEVNTLSTPGDKKKK